MNSGVNLQTPRRALGDVNWDVSKPANQHSIKKLPGLKNAPTGFSLNKEMVKNTVFQMKAPAPAKPLSIRSSNKQADQSVKNTKKKKQLLQSSVANAEKTNSSFLPVDDIEHMNVYHETEEEYEELVFPKRERPSTFLYGLGEWRPTRIVEDSDSDEEECLMCDLGVLSHLPDHLKRPPQIDDSLEDNLFELSLEELPDCIPLTSLDDLV